MLILELTMTTNSKTIFSKNKIPSKGTTRSTKKNHKKSSLLWKLLYLILFGLFVIGATYVFRANYNPYWFVHLKGDKAYNVYLPAKEYAFNGLDISRYQGDIDWVKLREMKDGKFPLTFLFFKATEGQDYLDKYYIQNMDSARKEGYICGSYHFFRNNKTGIEQADNFIQNCHLKRGDLAPVLDIEESPKSSTEDFRHEVQVCLDKLEQRYGCKPIIYANVSFKKKYLDTEKLNQYPLWIANYYVNKPKGNFEWRFWQFTDRGRVPGIRGYVDMNVMQGTSDILDAMRIQ